MPSLDRSLIRDLELFRALDDAALDSLLAKARPRRVEKGTTVFEQGQEARDFFVLLHGYLKVTQTTPAGRQVVVRFISPGELFGVAVALRRPDYPGTATAVVDSLALVWRSSDWAGFLERHPALATNAFHTVGQRLTEAHSRVRELATEEVEQRIAHALLRLVRQSGRPVEEGVLIDFPLSRQDIAEMTGTTLHTVSRTLSAWERQGIVESGRQRLAVRSQAALARLAREA
jgi:CRP-like cAMP-binding protein